MAPISDEDKRTVFVPKLIRKSSRMTLVLPPFILDEEKRLNLDQKVSVDTNIPVQVVKKSFLTDDEWFEFEEDISIDQTIVVELIQSTDNLITVLSKVIEDFSVTPSTEPEGVVMKSDPIGETDLQLVSDPRDQVFSNPDVEVNSDQLVKDPVSDESDDPIDPPRVKNKVRPVQKLRCKVKVIPGSAVSSSDHKGGSMVTVSTVVILPDNSDKVKCKVRVSAGDSNSARRIKSVLVDAVEAPSDPMFFVQEGVKGDQLIRDPTVDWVSTAAPVIVASKSIGGQQIQFDERVHTEFFDPRDHQFDVVRGESENNGFTHRDRHSAILPGAGYSVGPSSKELSGSTELILSLVAGFSLGT